MGRDKAGHRVTSAGLRARRGVKSHSQELAPNPPALLHTIQPPNSFLRWSSESGSRLTSPKGTSSSSGAAGDSVQPPFSPRRSAVGSPGRGTGIPPPRTKGVSHSPATRLAHHVCARGCCSSTEAPEQTLAGQGGSATWTSSAWSCEEGGASKKDGG